MHSYISRLRDVLRRSAAAPAASGFTLSAPLSGSDVADLAPNILLYIDAPALTVGELPDASTLTYTLIECSDIALSSVVSSTVMGVQTGAGGAGAAAATFAARPKYAGGSYWGLKVSASSGVNVSGLTFTLAIALT
jgi:hypothetical protein